MGVASLVLGIIAVLITIFAQAYGYIGIILGVIGIVLAAIGMKKNPAKKGLAVAGLVLSIIATALCSIVWISCVICAAAISTGLSGL